LIRLKNNTKEVPQSTLAFRTHIYVSILYMDQKVSEDTVVHALIPQSTICRTRSCGVIREKKVGGCRLLDQARIYWEWEHRAVASEHCGVKEEKKKKKKKSEEAEAEAEAEANACFYFHRLVP
jgi:hypothetical protein